MGCISGKHNREGKSMSDLNDDDPFHNCDTVDSYVEVIHNSVIAGECELTLRAFHKCDSQKRRDIAEKYASSFHSDLSADVTKLSWKAGFIVDTLLMDGSLSHAARYLAYCLQDGVWKHNMAVVEILVGHSANELAEIEKEYLAVSGRTITCDLTAECDDGLVRDILIQRLSLKESPDTEEEASTCAGRLVLAARSGTLFGDDQLFQECMKTKSARDLKLILEMFLKLCQRDMPVEIEKHYPAGHTRRALVTMVKLLRNKWLYYAHVIHGLMTDEGTTGDAEVDQRHLLYLVLSLDQDGVRELKQVYKSAFFETLSGDVHSYVTDTLVQRALLHHSK